MTIYLRQSTASQEVLLGPAIDDTDFKTPKTGLTIANTDIKVWKAGATTLANKNSGGATEISGGYYYGVFDATDTDTAGSMRISIKVATALIIFADVCVLPAQVYDSMIAGSDLLDVSLVQVTGATTDVSALATNVAAILVDTGTTLQAELDGIQADTEDIQTRLPAALVGGRIDATVDGTGMEAGATAAIRDALLLRTTASGVVGSGSTTANVVASSVAVGATTSLSADAWKGRVIIFNADTTTAALRGQAAVIVSHTSGSTPTFTLATGAWTTAPLTTDTFTVV